MAVDDEAQALEALGVGVVAFQSNSPQGGHRGLAQVWRREPLLSRFVDR
jgi:hypothetical protein